MPGRVASGPARACRGSGPAPVRGRAEGLAPAEAEGQRSGVELHQVDVLPDDDDTHLIGPDLRAYVAERFEIVDRRGTPVALEPMNAPDRKVVHDTVNEIDGVRTMSEGEDTRRRVVILPD